MCRKIVFWIEKRNKWTLWGEKKNPSCPCLNFLSFVHPNLREQLPLWVFLPVCLFACWGCMWGGGYLAHTRDHSSQLPHKAERKLRSTTILHPKVKKVCAPCPSFKNKIHKTSVFSGSLFVQVVCSATQKCLQERLNCSWRKFLRVNKGGALQT